MFFRYAHFSKTAVLHKREHHFWGFRRSQSFPKIMIFYVFSKEWFLRGPEVTFFDFGRFWGPPKSTLTLQKACFYLGESTVFKKSWFFYKKSVFQKNIIFDEFWTSKNHKKSKKERGEKLTFGRLGWPRGPRWPQDPSQGAPRRPKTGFSCFFPDLESIFHQSLPRLHIKMLGFWTFRKTLLKSTANKFCYLEYGPGAVAVVGRRHWI